MSNPCKLPVRKKQRKYDAVVKASCQLFLKHGYTRTSMDAVAECAKVSKQTLYSYFKNKDDLFCQMIEAECERYSPCETMLNPNVEPDKALYAIGRGFMDLIGSAHGLAIHRLVMSEAENHPRIAKLFYESGPQRMQNLLVTFLNRHTPKHYTIDDTNKAAIYFYSLIKGRYQQRMLLNLKPLPTKKEMDAHVRDVVRIFLEIYAK